MQQHLVILTSEFPYGVKGETFLEDELPLLASRFAQITIIAEHAQDERRPLPPHCRVQHVSQRSPRWRDSISLLSKFLKLLWSERQRVDGVAKFVHVVRSLRFYLLRAEAYVRVFSALPTETTGPVCFYAYWMDYRALAAVMLAAQHNAAAALSRAHGYDVYEARHPHNYLPLRSYLCSHLDAVCPISSDGAKTLAVVAHPAAKIRLSRLGVRAEQKVNLTRALDRLCVLSIGSLIPLKRPELLVESLSLFDADAPVYWIHIGDGPLRASIEAQARSALKIDYSLLGNLPNSKVRDLLRQLPNLGVLVNTSSTEGIPVSMMEAMSCSLPCIGTQVGGVHEIISHEANGYLLSPDPTPGEVHATLVAFLALSAKQKQGMAGQAYQTWLTTYNAETNYATFSDFVESLLSGS